MPEEMGLYFFIVPGHLILVFEVHKNTLCGFLNHGLEPSLLGSNPYFDSPFAITSGIDIRLLQASRMLSNISLYDMSCS